MTDKQINEIMKDSETNGLDKAKMNFVKKYEESTEIIMSVAQSIQKTFKSWNDIGLSYVHGYEFWSGESIDTQGSSAAYRMDIHNRLLNHKNSPYNTLNWDMSLEPNDN